MRNSILTPLLRLGVYLLLCLISSVPLQAQRYGLYGTTQRSTRYVSFDVSAGAGYSQLGYRAAETDLHTSSIGDYGLNLHIGADYFFSTYFGFGIGADFTRYGQSLSMNGVLTWNGVTDTDADNSVYGERYDHTLTIHQWRERQQQLYMAPQMLLLSVVPFPHASLLIEAGVEYAFCVQSSYAARGDIEHTGYYDKWGLTLHDVPAHGFYHTTDFAPAGSLNDRFANRQQLSVIGKIGVLFPLTSRLDLQVNALCKYAVYVSPNTDNTAGGTAQLGTDIGFHENQTAGDRDPHYFIPEYASLTTTSVVRGTYNPLLAGIEIGIRYRIPVSTVQTCRCMVDF